MFDSEKSEALKSLKKRCAELKLGKTDVGDEIFCEGKCDVKGKVVEFYAESIPEDFEETLYLGMRALDHLDEYIDKAKDLIHKYFWESYIEDWDGDPSIDEEVFKNKLSLSTVAVYQRGVISLHSREDGMFGGHILEANSLNKGKTFTEAEM